MKNTIFFFIFITISMGLQAQNKKKNSELPPPNSFDPNPVYLNKSTNVKRIPKITSNKAKSKSSKNRSFEWQLDQKKKEFDKRMVANAKRYKKEARISKKPQYSDPSYFGHKRKPKKRPVGRRKLCKECLIVH